MVIDPRNAAERMKILCQFPDCYCRVMGCQPTPDQQNRSEELRKQNQHSLCQAFSPPQFVPARDDMKQTFP
jgi:hypothetical protein